MSAVDELVAFVRARLDERERVALAADPGPWEVGPTFGARDSRVYVREADHPGIDTIGTCVIAGQVANKTRFRENAAHIALNDPAAVLADIAAKRAILDMHEAVCDEVRKPTRAEHRANARARQFALEEVLKLLAQPYAGREGWRTEWAT